MTNDSREQRLHSILHAYLQTVDRGEQPDRQALLDANPELAAELAAYFADESKLRNLAHSLATQHFAPVDKALTLDSMSDASAAPALPRVRYFGDYELLEEIARGGMGVVFKARQVSLNRTVALKMILKGELATDADVRRFQQEAEAAASLDHPNIVPIYEVGEHEAQQYFSMKLIETAVAGKPSPREAAQRLAKVARAVHHAHQRGILHRDLKPSNILIDSNGEPHVADFGLAKKVEGDVGATRTGAIVGTPAYMAPEQARADKSLTTAVDVYSLGVILYEWLAGCPPFRGDDPLSTLMKVVNDEPVKPSFVDPKIDRDLETICLKCLEKDLAKRYASAEALADDLESWFRGEPITARPAGQMERAWRWCRRNPAIASLTVAVAVLLLTAALLGGLTAQHFRAAAAREAAAAKTERTLRAGVESERDAKGRALRRAEGLRLLAQSEAQRAVNPGQALLLALAGAERQPGLLADSVLRAALDANCERPTLQDHTRGAHTARFSPDGRRIITTFHDGTHRLWETNTGQTLHVLRDLDEAPKLARFSPDGKRIVTVSHLQTARIWDATTGQLLHRLSEPVAADGQPFSLFDARFSPDGRCVVTAGGDARLWDAMTGKLLRVLDSGEGRVNGVEYSADGAAVLTFKTLGAAHLWDGRTGKRRRSFRKAPGDGLQSACLSLDGQRVATFGIDPIIWDAQTGKEVVALHKPGREFDSPYRGSLFSPDGRRVLGFLGCFGDVAANLILWDAQTGQVVFHTSFGGSGHDLLTAIFTPDGRHVIAGSSNHLIYIVRADTGLVVQVLRRHTSMVRHLDVSSDGRLLLSGADDQTVRLWNLVLTPAAERANGIWSATGSATASPDGRQFATSRPSKEGMTGVVFWDAATGTELFRVPNYAYHAVFSLDWSHCAVWNSATTVRVWNLAAREPGVILPGRGDCVQLSSNGRRLVTQDLENRRLHLWETATGKELARFDLADQDEVYPALVGSGDELMLAIRNRGDGRFRFGRAWAVRGGRQELPFELRDGGTDGRWHQVAFSSDGQRMVAMWAAREFRLWDPRTGQEIATLGGNQHKIYQVCFSPDSSKVVTLTTDARPRVWDAATGRLLFALDSQGTEKATRVSCSPDSRLLVLPDGSLWNTRTGELLAQLIRGSEVAEAIGFAGNDRVLLHDNQWTLRLVPVDALAAARARRPRDFTAAERQRFELP